MEQDLDDVPTDPPKTELPVIKQEVQIEDDYQSEAVENADSFLVPVESIKTECKEKCKTESDVDEKGAHSEPTPKEEKICDEDYLDESSLIKHEEIILKDEEEQNGESPDPPLYTARITYKCDQCDYQTVWKSSLKRHNLVHKKPGEAIMYKCDQCDFQTLWKSNLMHHYIRHKKPKKAVRYKCDQCDYETLRESNLKRHNIFHEKFEEAFSYRCLQPVRKTYMKKTTSYL